MQASQAKPHAYIVPLKVILVAGISLLLLEWLLHTPPGLLGKADAIAYAVCHRISARSFHLDDRQLPLCARCTGMFLAALLGLIYQSIRAPRRTANPPLRVWVVLGVLGLAFAVDGVNSYLHLFPGMPGIYEPQNWLRLLTGSGMGLAIAIVLYPAFNQTIWKEGIYQPAIPGLRSLLLLMLITGAVDVLVLSENPLVLYPLAIISAVSVVILLTMVYTMIVLILFHRDGRYQAARQLVFPLLAGFGVALLQIAMFDALRFFFTGTWGGFIVG